MQSPITMGLEPLRGRVVYLRESGLEIVDVSPDTEMERIARDMDRAVIS